MASRSTRPSTRSRVNTDASSSGAVSDVSKFLHDLSRKTTRSTREASAGTSMVRAAIDRRVKALGHTVGIGPSRISLTEEYVEAVERALVRYLERLLGSMVTVSLHRSGEDSEYSMGEQTTETEEWLLHKEDLTAYMRKILLEKASYVSPQPEGAPLPVSPPPEFIKSDYASQAIEDENKLQVTARSVRRICARDLLPLIGSKVVKIPSRLQANLVSRIAVHELNADYRNRIGSSAS